MLLKQTSHFNRKKERVLFIVVMCLICGSKYSRMSVSLVTHR